MSDVLDRALRPYRRAAARDNLGHWLLIGLCAAFACLLLLELAQRAWILSWAATAELAAVVMSLALALGWGLAHGPSPTSVARAADARLQLKERLASAMQAGDSVLGGLLVRDAVAAAKAGRAAAAFPLVRHRRRALLLLGLATVCVVLALLPNPRDAELARQRTDKAAIAAVAGKLAKAQAAFAAAARDTTPERAAELEQALKEAQQRVANAGSPYQALQDVSALNDRLAQLRDPALAGRQQAAQAAGSALAGPPGATQLSQDLRQGRSAAAAGDLKALGRSLSNLTAAQQNQLGQALQAGAAAAGGDSRLQQALGAASSALASGNTTAAQASLNAAAQATAAQASDQAFQSALAQAQAATQQAQQQAANAANGGSPAGQGQGQGQGQGRGQGQGAGSGQGQGQGRQGTGSGQAPGRNPDPGNPNEPIYVTGQPGSGLDQPDPGPLGPGQDVPQQGYQSVIGAYQRDAVDALDRSAYDPGNSDLIRHYFSSLGGPTP